MVNFENNIIRNRRKTIALVITDNGELQIRAPLKASLVSIKEFVIKNISWIEKKVQEKKAFIEKHRNLFFPEKFVDGDRVSYQGENYQLKICDSKKIYVSDTFNFPKIFLPQAKQRLIIWLKHQAASKMVECAEYFSATIGLQYTDLKITSAKGIWGSCNPKGKIAINWRLVMAPAYVFNYIVVHEIVHLAVRSHSKLFWEKVAKVLPDYKKAEQWIKKHGGILLL